MFTFIISIVAFIALEVFALAAGHNYQHWSKVLGVTLPDPKRLITNYTYGMLSILIPFTVWTVLFGYIYPLLVIFMVLWVFAGSGGAAVKLMYWHDAKVAERQKLQDTLEIQELKLHQKDDDGQTARL